MQNSDILAGRVTLAEAEESIGEKVEKYRSKAAEERQKETESIESRLAMLEKLHASGAIDWEMYQSKYAQIMKEAGLNEEE